MSILKKIRENIIRHRWLICFFLLIWSLYILVCGIIIWQYPQLYNSPDETANAFFSKVFATTGQFSVAYPLNTQVSGIVHPRSVFVLGDSLIPGSFLGLPVLYGALGFVFGLGVMPWLTIVFTLFASVALYGLIKKQWSSFVAKATVALFLLHPAVVYYSARGFMHNVLFIDLLIISLFFLFCLKQKWYVMGLSGLFLSLCLATRTSEIFWVGGCGVLLMFFFWRYVTWSRVLWFVFGMVLGFLPFLLIHHDLFGKYCLSPYTCLRSVQQISASAQQETPVTTVSPVEVPRIAFWQQDISGYVGPFKVLFPFGVVPLRIVRAVWEYGVWMFAALSVFAVVGWVLLWRQKNWFYLCITVFISVWLSVYYGSWQFVDNINGDPMTLGNSFVRYFLPMYVVCLPCVVLGVQRLSHRWVTGVLCTGFVMWSVWFVWSYWPESLAQVQETLAVNQQQKAFWLQYVPQTGVIITERQDKVFFPERFVIADAVVQMPFVSDLKTLDAQVPVFYHTMLRPQDIEYIEETRLEKKLHFVLVDGPYHGYFLYELQ